LNDRLEEAQGTEELMPAARQLFDTDAAAPAGYPPANITVQDPACCLPADAGQLLKPPQVFVELIRRLPQESRFFIDNSNSVPWSIHYFFHSRPECYHLSIEFASMAWAIGAAIGAAFGDSRAPSVCITGDGCYLMSGQEITVAVERQLPVLFVVLNDRAYGLIRHAHRMLGKEPVDFTIPPVDFVMMARSAGAQAHAIREAKDFDRIDWQALALRKNPTLLDVMIDPEARPPLAMA
jgi:acetolactate synthase-1/2/3 large subunit